MKTSVIAPLLNAVLPGAGLWYLNRRGQAAANFLLAVLVTALASVSGSQHVHYVILAIAAGSAGYAHAAAGRDDNDIRIEPT